MAEPDGADAHLLVVDDEEANLFLLRHMLTRAGYRRVETIQRSSEVMARVRAEPPDLILLDLHMPPPDGFELIRLIRAELPPDDILPILVLTADATSAAKELALGQGAHDFLTKPFHYPELLLRVRNLLSVRSIHAQVRSHDAEVTRRLSDRDRADQDEQERLDVVARRIDAVIDEVALDPVYQPVVDLHDGAIVGAEALTRFRVPDAAPPDRWFLEADLVGRRIELELLAIEQALAGLPELPASAFISLNAGVDTIRSGGLLDSLAPHPGWRLVIELTEHDAIDDYDELTPHLDRLRDRGMRLAVDDTGAGTSSLRHILRLSPDIIKLDRALLAGIDQDPIRRSLMTAMVHFAAETATMLIGEGIEEVEELAVLRSLGLSFGQGYLLGRPAPLPLLPPALPNPPTPTTVAASAAVTPAGRSLAELLHDGPMQELSAASIRLQLLGTVLGDGPGRGEVELALSCLDRAMAQLGDLGSTHP